MTVQDIVFSYLLVALIGLSWVIFSRIEEVGPPYKIMSKAPSKDAFWAVTPIMILVSPVMLMFYVPWYLVKSFYKGSGIFVRGVRDLLPKRKTKLPEARIHHG